jgi:NAD(P)H-flavin reductase
MGRLLDRRSVGGGLFRHEIEPPMGFGGSYRFPGQYVSLALSEKQTYFVLAGEPASGTWEVLVHAGGDVADALLALPTGEPVRLSAALGQGFPMGEAAGRRLFVLATGSGVAAIRPVVAARVRAGLATSTEVFLGVRSRVDLPLADELATRRDEGVGVTVCLSRDTVVGVGAASGYVQEALLQRATERPESVKGAMIFAAGASAMVDGVKQVARTLGLAEADVRTNY